MKVWLYSVCYNEALILPYALRHYTPWIDRWVVWLDRASNDGSRELLQAPKVEVREWPHDTGLDDEEFIRTANYWPSHEGRKVGADWVGFVDCDELLYAPDPLAVLKTTETDIIRARGYALISKSGWPQDDGRQLYEQVRTGTHQENHSKFLLWRPGFDIGHHHGRHDTPHYRGRIETSYRFKNIHCHHVGGVSATATRNNRNLQRAHDKKFAWNYHEDSEAKGIGGTAKWVAGVLEDNLLDVLNDQL